MKLLLFLTLFGVTVGNPRQNGRIVGGVPVNIDDYPYQLSLQYNNKHICGASIISQFWALTAAHCTSIDNSASPFSLRAGSSYQDFFGTVYQVLSKQEHPWYDKISLQYDFALLRLSSPIAFGPGIQPIGLPPAGQDPTAGTMATVTGWGLTWEGGSPPFQLHMVHVPIVSRSVCNDSYGGIFDNMICAGYMTGAQDSCMGDNGGPLVTDYVLTGVISFGHGCARPNYPGVYSRVGQENARNWITQITGL